jgi:hypothetical protein
MTSPAPMKKQTHWTGQLRVEGTVGAQQQQQQQGARLGRKTLVWAVEEMGWLQWLRGRWRDRVTEMVHCLDRSAQRPARYAPVHYCFTHIHTRSAIPV